MLGVVASIQPVLAARAHCAGGFLPLFRSVATLPRSPRESFYGVLSLPLLATLSPLCRKHHFAETLKLEKNPAIWFPHAVHSPIPTKQPAHSGICSYFQKLNTSSQSHTASFGGKNHIPCFLPAAQFSKSHLRQTLPPFPSQQRV